VELQQDDLDHDRQLTRSNMEAQIGEDNHLATAMDHSPKVNYSRITQEAGMAMKKASGDDYPLR
jgi:hypothetical protein